MQETNANLISLNDRRSAVIVALAFIQSNLMVNHLQSTERNE